MDDDVAISVSHVHKTFKLPHEKQSSLKGAAIGLFRRKGARGFERQHVLKDVSFEVKKGEFFGIVGRNGSGKSTLLKLLAEIYVPNSGELHVRGKLTPFIELGVGFNPELTGRENVFLNGALLGFNHKEMDAMYDDIVAFAELERFMDQKLKNYSSGMQVRLAFSIAIKAQSDILLIDEVLAVGDAAFQRKCFDHFMLLKKNKQTVVLVTHDMAAVRQYCDRAVMIDKGEVVERGKPEDVAQAYQQLFSEEMNEDHEASGHTKGGKRWGNGKVQASTTTAKVGDDFVTIKTVYQAKQAIEPPVFGFTVYGPAGSNILEGNTLRQNIKTTSLSKGDTVEVTWQIPNVFATGDYSVAVACCDQSTIEYYDWFNGAVTFKITRDWLTAGVVDPPLSFKATIK
jgi:ABC-2 type transport system ATP-binding protein